LESLYELPEIELELVKDTIGMELVSRYEGLDPPVGLSTVGTPRPVPIEGTEVVGDALFESEKSLFTVLVKE